MSQKQVLLNGKSLTRFKALLYWVYGDKRNWIKKREVHFTVYVLYLRYFVKIECPGGLFEKLLPAIAKPLNVKSLFNGLQLLLLNCPSPSNFRETSENVVAYFNLTALVWMNHG